MRLGIDMDGVVYDWEGTARFLLKWHHNYDLPVSCRWDFIKDNIENNDWQWLWSAGVKKYGLFRHGDCYRGTFEALRELDKAGHDIVIITKRPKEAAKDTLAWLAFHEVPAREVHIIGPDGHKGSITCDVYVDDSPKVAMELEEAGLRCLLWTRPWNTAHQASVDRISNWKTLLFLVEKMEREKNGEGEEWIEQDCLGYTRYYVVKP
jgi:uncharacterized HAD superfamily protein